MMASLDIKTAYSVFGLDPSAGMEQVEKQYEILLRRNHQLEREGKADEQSHALFAKYTEAYKFLRGELVERTDTRWDKVRNFLSYNIIKIVVITGVLALLISAGFAWKTSKDIDVTLHFAGEIDTQIVGLQKVSAILYDKLPEIGKIAVGSTPLRNDYNSSVDVTNSNKIFIDMTMNKTDVFVIDRFIFDKYVGYGIFLDLTALADEAGIPQERREGLKVESEKDTEAKLYGIDVTKSAVIYDAGILGDKKVVVVLARSDHIENALELVKVLLPESDHYFK